MPVLFYIVFYFECIMFLSFSSLSLSRSLALSLALLGVVCTLAVQRRAQDPNRRFSGLFLLALELF
jgi:hypothetical protein